MSSQAGRSRLPPSIALPDTSYATNVSSNYGCQELVRAAGSALGRLVAAARRSFGRRSLCRFIFCPARTGHVHACPGIRVQGNRSSRLSAAALTCDRRPATRFIRTSSQVPPQVTPRPGWRVAPPFVPASTPIQTDDLYNLPREVSAVRLPMLNVARQTPTSARRGRQPRKSKWANSYWPAERYRLDASVEAQPPFGRDAPTLTGSMTRALDSGGTQRPDLCFAPLLLPLPIKLTLSRSALASARSCLFFLAPMSDFKNAATPPPAEKAVIDSRSSTSGDDSTSSPTTGKLEGGLIDDEEYRRREKALVWKIDKNVIPFLTYVHHSRRSCARCRLRLRLTPQSS